MVRPRRVSHFAGVLGWPLQSTLSPAIHNAAFRKLGLDWVYLRWPVPPDSLGAAVAGLRALGATGANVTIPHKEQIKTHLDECSGDALAIGAVNTIQRVGDLLVGHNTDVDGFTEFIASDVGFDARGTRALVLGAGGAARAVVAALARMGAGTVIVAGRRGPRTAEVAGLAGSAGRGAAWTDLVELVAGADVIVNATPLGGTGEDPAPDARLRRDQLVVDLVYDPPTTPLLERARSAGADAWGGLGMLVHQAAASFRIWTGMSAPLEAMSAAAVHALGLRTRGREGYAN
jgi:shikimate dehydrogenase